MKPIIPLTKAVCTAAFSSGIKKSTALTRPALSIISSRFCPIFHTSKAAQRSGGCCLLEITKCSTILKSTDTLICLHNSPWKIHSRESIGHQICHLRIHERCKSPQRGYKFNSPTIFSRQFCLKKQRLSSLRIAAAS